MVLSVEGEKIQRASSSFSILVPASLGGEMYSVYALVSPTDQDFDSMVRDVLGPWITIFEVMTRFSECMFSSIRSMTSCPDGYWALSIVNAGNNNIISFFMIEIFFFSYVYQLMSLVP